MLVTLAGTCQTARNVSPLMLMGNAYVAGWTRSQEGSFPVAVGPDLTFNGGEAYDLPWDYDDAFIAKVRADGSGLIYAGYIGGAFSDWVEGIAVDTQGNAYVAGTTRSNESTFPVIARPDLTFNENDDIRNSDGFVAKVRADGSGLIYAGYIGGDDFDYISGVSVDGEGRAYVAGSSYSYENSFPVAIGPGLTHKGGEDAFVAKLRGDGTGLVYAGYIGGGARDYAKGVSVDSAGNAYVVGVTHSDETSFPVVIGPSLAHANRDDGLHFGCLCCESL